MLVKTAVQHFLSCIVFTSIIQVIAAGNGTPTQRIDATDKPTAVSTLILAVCSSGAALLVAMVGFLCFCKKKKKGQEYDDLRITRQISLPTSMTKQWAPRHENKPTRIFVQEESTDQYVKNIQYDAESVAGEDVRFMDLTADRMRARSNTSSALPVVKVSQTCDTEKDTTGKECIETLSARKRAFTTSDTSQQRRHSNNRGDLDAELKEFSRSLTTQAALVGSSSSAQDVALICRVRKQSMDMSGTKESEQVPNEEGKACCKDIIIACHPCSEDSDDDNVNVPQHTEGSQLNTVTSTCDDDVASGKYSFHEASAGSGACAVDASYSDDNSENLALDGS